MASTKADRREKKWRFSNAEESRYLIRIVVNNPSGKKHLKALADLYRNLGHTDIATKIAKKLGKI